MKLTEEQIAAELRAMRPAPPPQFAAALDVRAADGFGRGAPRTPFGDWYRGLVAVPPRRLVPVLGAAATLVVVSAVALSQISTESGRDDSGVPSALTVTQAEPASSGPSRASKGAVDAETAVPAPSPVPAPPPPGGDLAPGVKQRQVERTASLALSSEAGEVADVADGVVKVTDRYGGFIVSSDVRTGDGTDGSQADFDLRVPTARLQEALSDLSGLAHVKSRNEGSLDITAPAVTAQERLKDAQATVDGLLDQLGTATTTAETDALRTRLRAARAELSAARAESDQLSQRASLTAIDVTITGEGDGGPRTLGDAADDALSVLRTIAGIALIGLAVLVPLGLLGTLLWLGGRGARRRSRERALDSRA